MSGISRRISQNSESPISPSVKLRNVGSLDDFVNQGIRFGNVKRGKTCNTVGRNFICNSHNSFLHKQDSLTKYKKRWLKKNFGCEFFRDMQSKQKQMMENTKIYLNMVVHDLRNPAHQINFSIQNAKELIKLIESI